MMAEPSLLPCPFCGGRADVDNESRWTFCEDCGIGYEGRDEETRRARWNRRTRRIRKRTRQLVTDRERERPE